MQTSVVMSQPGAAPQLTTVEVRGRAPEHMIITVVLLTVVGIVNPTTLLCFCPAFIFASLVRKVYKYMRRSIGTS